MRADAPESTHLQVEVSPPDAQNAQLLANAPPADWRKPRNPYNLVVLGGGTAGDMIATYTTVITHGLSLGVLAKVIQLYPTQAEAVRKTGDVYNRTRLTPRVKRLMAAWLRWQRGR